MKLHDDDLAEKAEMHEQDGLDKINAMFPPENKQMAKRNRTRRTTPHLHTPTSAPVDARGVTIGVKVRVLGRLFEEEAKLKVGSNWRGCFFHVVITSQCHTPMGPMFGVVSARLKCSSR